MSNLPEEAQCEVVRYNYRLRPGARAERALLDEWDRCRWLWNEAVHQYKSGKKPTLAKLCKLLTEARSGNTWLRDGSQVAQQQVLRAYTQSLNHSFSVRGRKRPVFKRKGKSLPTLGYTRRNFALTDGRLRLPGKVFIPVVWSRELPSDPTSVQVFQDSLGHWYASFVVRRDLVTAPEANGSIGIDWGVTTTATTTNPAYDLPHHGFRKRCAAELAKAQRKMARRRPQPGHPSSKGYLRAKRQAAKLYKKAARQNQHTARQWAKAVVEDHQAIAIEDFKPTFLAKSTMARKAADAAIGAAKRELIQQGERAGRKIVLVPPAYTTMTCSGCFARATQRLQLHERTFVCTSCGLTLGRDLNAARVILATVERDRAGADGVRHAITSSGSGSHAA